MGEVGPHRVTTLENQSVIIILIVTLIIVTVVHHHYIDKGHLPFHVNLEIILKDSLCPLQTLVSLN